MRFAVSIVCAAAIGALSVTAVRTISSQTSMFQAVRALGGDISQIRLADLDPRKAYDDVIEKIRSGSVARSIEFNSSTPNVTFPNAANWSPPQWNFKNNPAFQNALASGMNARIQQDIRRAQDLTAYGRNPPAWHGFPPR
jgi:hypothetical protein